MVPKTEVSGKDSFDEKIDLCFAEMKTGGRVEVTPPDRSGSILRRDGHLVRKIDLSICEIGDASDKGGRLVWRWTFFRILPNYSELQKC